MVVGTRPAPFTDGMRGAFETFASRRDGAEPERLRSGRTRALEAFLDQGLPTTDQEEWRFTNVAPIGALTPRLGEPNVSLSRDDVPRFGTWKRHELVFVNGHFSKSLSSVDGVPRGVTVTSLAEALAERPETLEAWLGRGSSEADGEGNENPFVALNRAFVEDGAFIQLESGVVVEEPIHLVFLTAGADGATIMMHPRNLVLAGKGSQARILETFTGRAGSAYLTNTLTEIRAGAGAVVDHYKLQQESAAAFHVGTIRVLEERDASVTSHSLSLGARLARNDIQARLGGEGSDVTLNGLYVVTGSQLVDHHTVIDHGQPHCTSRELYKGILDGASRGVFNGKVIVRPDAQKTDASQTNKNLLLSEDALVNTNPQLEIHADDVKCAHGATIGQLDRDALFYLRSRGIGREEARRILTQGFAADVSERIRIEALKTAVNRILYARAA